MRTIEVTTTQNVTIEYELASLRERIFAFLLDGIFFGVIYLLFISCLTSILASMRSGSLLAVAATYQALAIAGFILYQLISEVFANGQSWGKKILGLKVIRLDGKMPSLGDYLLRAVFHLIDTLFSIGILAILLVSSTRRGQRLGDLGANTTVIRLRYNLTFRLEDILKINSLDNYQPTYPQVTKLSEQDMLLIKSAINRFRRYPNTAHRNIINKLVLKLKEQLDIDEISGKEVEFLKNLLKDYVVLTR